MPEFATPKTPMTPRNDPFGPKQSLGAFSQKVAREEGPYTPRREGSGQPTEDNIRKLVSLGIDPFEVFDREQVQAAMPERQSFDPTQPGYKNNEDVVYDSEKNVVYDGDHAPFMVAEDGLQTPNPTFDKTEFEKNFFFEDGNWISAKTGNPVLPYRNLTGMEEFYMAQLDPLVRIGHQLQISTSSFLDQITQTGADKNSLVQFKEGMKEGLSDILNPWDDDFGRGFGYGWRTDVANNQPGYVKALFSIGMPEGMDADFFYRMQEAEGQYFHRKELASTRKTYEMNKALFTGMFTDEDSIGTKILPYLPIHPMGIYPDGVLDQKSFGRSIENFLTGAGTLFNHLADPAGAMDLALTGGFSMARKLRYMKYFDLAGDSRQVFDGYRKVLHAYGPDVLVETMRRANPDKMNANYWAKLYAETARKKRSAIPFKDLFTKQKYDSDLLKGFIALDPEKSIQRLGVEGYAKLVEMLPPAATINGKKVYNYSDLLQFSVKAHDDQLLRQLNTNSEALVPLFDNVIAKTAKSQSIVSEADLTNRARKTIEAVEETMVDSNKLLDEVTIGDGFVTGTREEIAAWAARQRLSKGFGNEKYNLKNQNVGDILESTMSDHLISKGAKRFGPKVDKDVIDTPTDFVRQLADPAIQSTTGVMRFRKTDWVKYKKHVDKFANRDSSWWRNFLAKDETFRFQVGGKMGGVTEDAIKIIKTDMADLSKWTKNLDTYEANIERVTAMLKKYPKLKAPGQFRKALKVKDMTLQFGPKMRFYDNVAMKESDIWGEMPGLKKVTELDGTFAPIDKAGRVMPDAADKFNLFAAQRKIWDGGLLPQDVADMGRHIDNLDNGVVAGGKYKDQGEAIDGLLQHLGLDEVYHAKKVDGVWSVFENSTIQASDTALAVINRSNKLDMHQLDKIKRAVANPNLSKIDISENLSNEVSKRSLADMGKEAKGQVDVIDQPGYPRLPPPRNNIEREANTMWQQERMPGGVALGDIRTDRLDEAMGDDLISNWNTVTTAEQDAQLLKQLEGRLLDRFKIERSGDHIAIVDRANPGQPLARAEAGETMHGRAIMRAIEDSLENGPQIQFYSNPLPEMIFKTVQGGLLLVSKPIVMGADTLKNAAKAISSAGFKKLPDRVQETFSDLKTYLGETSAKAWLDARERYGDMAYKELLRMREIWIRNSMRHNTMNKIIDDVADDLGIEKTWKNQYFKGKFRRIEKTKAGQQILATLEDMGRAAEGIKHMPSNGDEAKIIFGTKSYHSFMERVPTDTYRDGKAFAGQKKTGKWIPDENDPGTWNKLEIDGKEYLLTAENSKKLWNKLSATQKKYITEYTREGGTKDALFQNWETFNRNVAADYYNITTKREGFLHHSFHWDDISKRNIDEAPHETDFAPLEALRNMEQYEAGKLRYTNSLRPFTAGTRKYRKGVQGYKQNFLESVADYNLKLDREAIRNDAMLGFERNLLFTADEARDLMKRDPAKASRLTPYRPVYKHDDIAEGTELFVDNLIKKELTDTTAASRELSKLNEYLRMGKLQLLVAPMTWATNAAGGALQYSSFLLENVFRAGLGDELSGRRVKSTLKAFHNAMFRRMPAEIFGSRSNAQTQFGGGTTHIHKFLRGALAPMGAIENFFKRALTETELLARGKNWEDLITQKGRIKDMDEFFDIDKVTDMYGFNYDNKSQLAEFFQKNPYGVMMAPFATYPYKYSKMVSYYADALNLKSLTKLYDPKYVNMVGEKAANNARIQQMAKMATVSAVVMSAMAEALLNDREPLPAYKAGMDYRLDHSGRINFGWMDEDSYVRYVKYPGINVYAPIRKMFDRVFSGESLAETSNATWEEAVEVMNEMYFQGGVAKLGANMIGMRDKYTQNQSLLQLMVNQGYTYIPYLGATKRIGEDMNRLIEQGKGYVSKSKRGAWAQLMTQIPGTAWIDPRTQGNITKYSRPREYEWWRSLGGVNIRKIPKGEAKEERKRVEEREIRREERQEAIDIKGEYIEPTRTKRKRGRRRRKRR